MTTVTLRATGAAQAALAWDRYVCIDQWAVWAPQIRRVECDAERIEVGARGRVVGPAGLGVRFVIDAVDHATRAWSWRVSLGPVSLRLHHGVDDHPDGCRTWLRVAGPAPVVVAYAPVAALALRRLVAAW